MNIDRTQIIDLLTSQGDHEKADQAQAELPDTVDTDQHAGLLDKFGVNVADLAGKLPGGLGDKIGGLAFDDPPTPGWIGRDTPVRTNNRFTHATRRDTR